ncbi:hypothetical protein FOBRF1_012115 [Fusarium oxysporum]
MLLLSLLSLTVVAAHAVTPDRASNLPISPEVAAQYDCGETCQENLSKANDRDLEAFDVTFDFDFYATADNFSSSKPGEILKLKPYTSVDLDNSTIPATAFIAFPYVHQSDPFKLIAFAHGTSGVFRGCAPSTSSTFYDYHTWFPLLFSGYAVVARDYAGLGNNYTSHKYIAASANANNIYWSTVAAKKAFPSVLTDEWVSIGHSQGGGACWKLSEHALVQSEDSGYLGAVAIAPNTHIYDALIEGLSKLENPCGDDLQIYGSASYIPSIYFALKAVYPDFETTFLSDLARKRIELGELAQLCAAALPAVISDLNFTQIFPALDLESISSIKDFQDLNAPAQGDKASRPLLVIQGANDTTVFPELAIRAYNASCEVGNAVHISIYPELEHSDVFGASAPQWLKFIDGLFRSRQLYHCRMEPLAPVDSQYASMPLGIE